MSAVMAYRRIECDEPRDIHERCLKWGNWARCSMPGGEGTSEGYLRERLEPGHESLEPTPEIAETDRAVAQMYLKRPDYQKFFKRYYLNPTQLSEYEISNETGASIERVNAILRQARILVGYLLHQETVLAR
jgi:hypothetical protein